MALLQCEICGGRLTRKADGIYECDFCGMQYDTAWAKAKIQEIKGTVKVEGTVEVTGSVKIDGPVKVEGGISAESLLKRAQLALEDGEEETAREYFEKVLDMDPDCAEAYLGLAMTDVHVNTLEALVNKGNWENRNYRRGKQFAGIDLLKQLNHYEEVITARQRQEEEERQALEDALLQEQNARIERLKPLMERSREAAKLLSAGSYFTIAVNLEKQVLLSSSNITWKKPAKDWDNLKYIGDCWEADRIRLEKYERLDISSWQNISAVSAGYHHAVGLTTDGRVVASGYNTWILSNFAKWKNMVAVSGGGFYGCSHTVGLTADGRVLAVGENINGQCSVGKWQNIVAVSAGEEHTVGVTADGRVVATGCSIYGKCDVASWKNIVSVSAGGQHTAGLTADGRVVVTKNPNASYASKYDVDEWHDMIAVSAGQDHTVGLTADGRVKAVGRNDSGQCDVGGWKNIVAISAGNTHTVGLTADGRILTAGEKTIGRGDADQWKLFQNYDNWEEESRIAWNLWSEKDRIEREKREAQERLDRKKREEEARIARIQEEERKRQLKPTRERIQKVSGMIAAGWDGKAVAVRSDGRIVTAGYSEDDKPNVIAGWRNVIAIDIAENFTVGLTSDGCVLERGRNTNLLGQQDSFLTTWRNITAISAGDRHVAGLTADGKVVASPMEGVHCGRGECAVDSWRNIVTVSAGSYHTVGLKADGTVVATDPGDNHYFNSGQSKVNSWRNIVAISAGAQHTVGLTADGRVMAAGSNSYGQCKVGCWRDIVAVSAGHRVTVGVTVDGRVVSTNDAKVQDWRNIVAVSAGKDFILGLTSDGRVLSTDGVAVGLWKLFQNLDTIARERLAAKRRDQYLCQHCGGTFKGLFRKACTSCGKPKDY